MKTRITTLAAALLIAAPAMGSPSAAQADGGKAVYRCATADGRTAFSDEPCTGAARSQPWKPKVVAAGIQRSAEPAGGPAPTRTATAPRYDPFVECQRRGGRFEPASRICRLPDDAARQMFRPQ